MFFINKYYIYIADDDKNVCDLLKSQLVSENYIVQEFYNGEELLKRFSSEPCDLIITDIMMPYMSGYDLCREIRRVSDVPIIMISAKDEEIDRVLGLELGSDDYISKPFSLREITVKVRNMLRRAKSSTILNTEEKIIRAFINILSNCIKYTKDTIYINIEKLEGWIIVKISDNGKGFSKFLLENPFSCTIIGEKEGSGIGLSIIKKVIDGHKGKVTLDNKEEGGAIYIIQLPI